MIVNLEIKIINCFPGELKKPMTSPQNTNMQSFSNKTCWERWLVVNNQETVDKWQMPADDFKEQMGNLGRDLSSRVLAAEQYQQKTSFEPVSAKRFNGTYVMES